MVWSKAICLVATQYVTKSSKIITTKIDDAKTIAKFVYKNIIARFNCPKELMSDRGIHFPNDTISQLSSKHLIKHRRSRPYYPRINGQTEKTNAILYKIITKIV